MTMADEQLIAAHAGCYTIEGRAGQGGVATGYRTTPPEVDSTVTRALDADPGRRFPSVGDFAGSQEQAGCRTCLPSSGAWCRRPRGGP
jgi:hypothetical protein